MNIWDYISEQGYRKDSPDKDRPFNVIQSNRISMKDVDFPVRGISNTGEEKMMYPGEEYIFDGDYVIETPIKQRGGATRQDSIDVRDNAIKVAEYYKDYKETFKRDIGNDWLEVLNAKKEKIEDDKINKFRTKGEGVTTTYKPYLEADYYDRIDNNRFKQRELKTGVLDLDAPKTLFDKRIEPQFILGKTNVDPTDPLNNDMVENYQYDPLAVAPWDTLNPMERMRRLHKYGVSGTPMDKSKETIPTNKETIVEETKIAVPTSGYDARPDTLKYIKGKNYGGHKDFYIPVDSTGKRLTPITKDSLPEGAEIIEIKEIGGELVRSLDKKYGPKGTVYKAAEAVDNIKELIALQINK